MIILTQLIYLKEGQEAAFHAFEAVAMAAIARYNGRLLLRVRPDSCAFVAGDMENPYEIHLVEFPADADLAAFQADPERQQVLHLKEQSIRASVLVRGQLV